MTSKPFAFFITVVILSAIEGMVVWGASSVAVGERDITIYKTHI